ncbi:putative thiol-disulfide oxidoreductase DCC, partial [Haematococcus lacustris]
MALARASGPAAAHAMALARAGASIARLGLRPMPRAFAHSAGSPPSWQIRMLYDGDCPLCMKEVSFLRSRDAGKGRIDFVDVASPAYDPAANQGITFQQAMERIHAIQDDGTVLTDIAVFRKLYEAVGLGWVYAITANPTIERLANLVYGFWAKYRMQVTGREALEVILARRRAQGATSLCDSSAEAACELPESRKAAAVEASQQV